MANRLKGKVALITGGAAGFGKKTAETLKNEGAVVYISDINVDGGEKVAKEFDVNFLQQDVTKTDDWKRVIEKIKESEGKLNILVNNAGIGYMGDVESTTNEAWDMVHKVDLDSVFYGCKYALPLMRDSGNGSIINISSTAGILGFPLRSPYAASKWAIIGITKTLAMALGKFNIRVNAVCPGTIKGDRMKRVIKDKAKFTKISQKVIEKDFISMSSMNKWILEEDIGKMCSFLISDDSSKVSGQDISVDGHTERNN